MNEPFPSSYGPGQAKGALPEVVDTPDPAACTLKETADAGEINVESGRPDNGPVENITSPAPSFALPPRMISLLIMALLLLAICIPLNYFLQQRLQLEKHYRWCINQADLNEFALRPEEALNYYRMAIADTHKLGDSPKLEADLNYKASTLSSNLAEAEKDLSRAFDLYGHTPHCRGEQLRVGEKLVRAIEGLRIQISAETTEASINRTNSRRLPSVPLIERLHDQVFNGMGPETLDQFLKKMGKDPHSYDVRLALGDEYFARKLWSYAIIEYARCVGIRPGEEGVRQKLLLARRLNDEETVPGRELLLKECDVVAQMVKIDIDTFGPHPKKKIALEMDKLARLYRDTDQMELAEQMFRRVLDWSIENMAHFEIDPRISQELYPRESIVELTTVLLAQGKFAEADRFLQTAQARKYLNEKEVLSLRANGMLLSGHIKEGYQLLSQAGKTNEFAFGMDNPFQSKPEFNY